MNVFELAAKLTLDSHEFDAGLNKAKGIATTIGTGIGTAMKVGTVAVGAATAAVGMFAKSSVSAGAEFDKSMSQVAATMGLTMDQMQNEVGSTTVTLNGQVKEFSGNLREFARFMGQNTAFSATEAADALNYMALAGYDTQTSINMLPNVLNLAAAGSMDLATASDMVTDTQTAFGLTLERTSQMVDEMAKASSTGNTSVQQLGEAFLTVGGLAQELNGGMVLLADGTEKPVDGVQELEIALTAMANAGIKGSEAGTHMRNMLLKLSSPTSDGVKQLEALGVSVFDAEEKMRSLDKIFQDLNGSLGNLTQQEKIQAISELFNTRDLASAEALLNAIDSDWDKIGESILNAQGAAEQMASTQLDNLAGDITKFKSALGEAQITVSDKLEPALREFVQFGTEGLTRVTDAFKSGGLSAGMTEFGNVLSEGLTMIISELPSFINAGVQLMGALGQGLVQNAPVIFDALGQVGEQLGSVVMGLMTSAASKLGTMDWTATASSMASSLVNTFTGQGAQSFIAVGMQILTSLVSGIGQSLPVLIPAALQIITTIGNSIAENLPALMEAGVTLITGLVQGLTNPEALTGLLQMGLNIVTTLQQGFAQATPQLLELIPTLMQGLLTALVSAAPMLLQAVPQMLQFIPTFISSSVTLISEMAPMLIQAAIELVGNLIVALPEIIQGLIDALPALVTTIITSLVQAVQTALPLLLTIAPMVFATLVPALIQAAPQLLVVGPQIVLALVQGILQSIPILISSTLQMIQTIIETIVSQLTKFITTGAQLISKFIEGIKSKFGELKNTANNIIETIKSAIVEKIKQAKQWGADLMTNFISGITEKLKDLKGAVTGIAGTISSQLHFSEPDEGPLKDFHTFAPDMMKLFAEGIRDNTGIVTDQIGRSFDVADMIAEPFSKATERVTPANNTSEIVNLLTQIRDRGNVVVLEGDAARMFRVMQSESRKYYQTTGREAFT